ncbi:MAG: hypothetical protein ACT4O1_01190 [Gemmatimonadota bacterium]
MVARSRGVSLGDLRDVVAARVEAESLRSVARNVGMSPSGLQKFIDGASPYSATRQRLERWYVRETAAYRANVSEESALAALSILVRDLPSKQRAHARARVLEALEQSYPQNRRPAWLRKLRLRVGNEDRDSVPWP